MNPAWWLGYPVGTLASPWLAQRESAPLALALASLLFFRAFRERYLLGWGLGWITYGAFLFAARASESHITARNQAFCQATLAVAWALFALAMLLAGRARQVLTPVLVAVSLVVLCGGLQPFYFPEDSLLRQGLSIASRLIAILAGFELLRGRLRRLSLAPFLAGLGLFTLQWPGMPVVSRLGDTGALLLEVLFGCSLFLLVLEDSHVRWRRLVLLNEMVSAIQRGQHHGTMMQVALEKLKAAVGAKASWFRMLEPSGLVLTQHAGVSQEFLRTAGEIRLDPTLDRVLQESKAAILNTSEA